MENKAIEERLGRRVDNLDIHLLISTQPKSVIVNGAFIPTTTVRQERLNIAQPRQIAFKSTDERGLEQCAVNCWKRRSTACSYWRNFPAEETWGQVYLLTWRDWRSRLSIFHTEIGLTASVISLRIHQPDIQLKRWFIHCEPKTEAFIFAVGLTLINLDRFSK